MSVLCDDDDVVRCGRGGCDGFDGFGGFGGGGDGDGGRGVGYGRAGPAAFRRRHSSRRSRSLSRPTASSIGVIRRRGGAVTAAGRIHLTLPLWYGRMIARGGRRPRRPRRRTPAERAPLRRPPIHHHRLDMIASSVRI